VFHAVADTSTGFGIEPRKILLQPLFGEGIFTEEGPRWKQSREAIRRQLQHQRYRNLDVFHETVEEMIHLIRSCNGTLDLQPLFFRMTLDITTKFLFGESARSLTARPGSNERRFADAFDVVQQNATAQMQRYGFRWLGDWRRYRQARNALHQFTDEIIDRNLEESPDSLSHAFLFAIARDAPNRTALRGQALHVLAAGRDTTASLLSWIL
jgi:cytochrome P450